jgi:hypothetical protein
VAFTVTLQCDRCRRTYQLRTGDFRYYVVPWQPVDLPASKRITCSDRDGWCYRCRRPRAIELLLPPEVLPSGETPGEEAYARWWRERRSPPRCLWCGATTVEPMGETFQHPTCGGRFRAIDIEHGSPRFVYLLPAEGPIKRGWLWLMWSRLCYDMGITRPPGG